MIPLDLRVLRIATRSVAMRPGTVSISDSDAIPDAPGTSLGEIA